jgi:HAD superfamily hydrolase (TIGR01509 family)
MTTVEAVLWDMDGTLVDTEPYWMVAEHAIVEEHGGRWTDELAKSCVGNDLLVSARYIKENSTITWTPEQIVEELLARVVPAVRAHVPWRPGARELLLAARAADIPCALVTMSYAVLAQAVVDALPPGTFNVVVTGDLVDRGKPHPEPYARALRDLGAAPERSIALEDSPTGVASALAAGIPTLGIEHIVPLEPSPGLCLIDSLLGVTVADLESVVREGGLPGPVRIESEPLGTLG